MVEFAPSPLTGEPSRYIFTATIMGHVDAQVFFDDSTEFIFLANPDWLDRAYSEELPALDTGVLMRNASLCLRVSEFLDISFGNAAKIKGVDLGGGYGLFTRGMRDRGYDFYWTDPFTSNLFAKGFEANQSNYDVATAFEVFEHLADPISFLERSIEKFQPKVLFFSTVCFDPLHLPDADWWYWSFETGQHISFFSIKSLEYVAKRIGYRLVQLGGDLFAFAKIEITHHKDKISHRPVKLLNLFLRRVGYEITPVSNARVSLTFSDHIYLKSNFNDQDSAIDEN